LEAALTEMQSQAEAALAEVRVLNDRISGTTGRTKTIYVVIRTI